MFYNVELIAKFEWKIVRPGGLEGVDGYRESDAW